MATPFIVKAAIVGGGLFAAWQFTRGVSAVQAQLDDKANPTDRTMVQEGSNPDGSTTVRVSAVDPTGLHTQRVDPSNLRAWTIFQKRVEPTPPPENEKLGPTDVPTQHIYIGFGTAGTSPTPPVLFVIRTGRVYRTVRKYDAWEFRNRTYEDAELTKGFETGYLKRIAAVLEDYRGATLAAAHAAVKAHLEERLPAREWGGRPEQVSRWTTYSDRTNQRVFGPPKAIAVESSGTVTPRPVYNADGSRIVSTARRVSP